MILPNSINKSRGVIMLLLYGLYRVGATDDNPCDLFERIDFPVDEFFPPERCEFLDSGQDDISEPEDDSDCDCRRR